MEQNNPLTASDPARQPGTPTLGVTLTVVGLFLATYTIYYVIFVDRIDYSLRAALRHFEFIRHLRDWLQSFF